MSHATAAPRTSGLGARPLPADGLDVLDAEQIEQVAADEAGRAGDEDGPGQRSALAVLRFVVGLEEPDRAP